VTVLFCDVAGSTALGERLDPEALRGVMGRYFELARTAIERHGGTLEKFIGDAVMAVFGVPTVREDDALRAVRAAEELRDAAEVDVRIGVNTGEVVTGSGDSLVTGDAVNVGARLEQAASPGEVMLGEETYRLVRDAVDAELLPPLEAKGKAAPVTAYRLRQVTGDVAVARRLDAPFVGRERERRLLVDAWERSRSERACSLFTILGSAGVGKSRLAAEFLRDLDATVVHGRCLSYGEGITYWPVVEVVLQLLRGERPPSPAIAALLGDGGASADEIAFDVRKLFERSAADRPLVVVFDDLQWGEATFLDLVENVADWSRDAPILLLCLARPELLELRPAWGGGKLNATTVLLEPLSASETDVLIDGLLAGDHVQPALRERIRAAAGGNPLFVEQMLAMLEESPGEVTVPATIQALLAARLDQLPAPERSALERGAVEGQVFHGSVVAALMPDDPDVRAHLLGLVRKELVRPGEATLPNEEAFRFRHLLIRDAAYDALPKALRAELHERFAEWLESHAPSLVELDELLGVHLEQAARYRLELGVPDAALEARAAAHLETSGRRAYARGDLAAATNLFERAEALLPRDDERRLHLLPTHGRTLYELGDLESAERVLTAALEDGRRAGAESVAIDAAVELAMVKLHTASDEEGQAPVWRAAEAAIAFHEQTRDDDGLARAYLAAGQLAFWAGRLTSAVESLERALRHARAAEAWGAENAALGYVLLALLQGPTPVDEALVRLDDLEPLDEARRAHRMRLLRTRAELAAMQGDFTTARHEIATKKSLDESEVEAVQSALAAGPIELHAGDAVAAERELRVALDFFRAGGDWGHLASVVPPLGDALIAQGRVAEALELTDLIEHRVVPEDVDGQSGWHRLRARALAHDGRPEEAEASARRAVAIAGQTEFVLLHAAALAALAEVLDLAGRHDEAATVRQEAIAVHEAKGNVAGAAALRSFSAESGPSR
jgi:class 3 adenylate cyclase/tetratricopeptide (TPR) repeat protein